MLLNREIQSKSLQNRKRNNKSNQRTQKKINQNSIIQGTKNKNFGFKQFLALIVRKRARVLNFFSQKRYILIFLLILSFISSFIILKKSSFFFLSSKPTQAETIIAKKFKKEKIKFTYTDNNSGENLIVKTNQKTFFGLTRSTVYFSITNINSKEEPVSFQIIFPDNKGEVKKIEKWNENIPVVTKIPEYGEKSYFCQSEWQKQEEITNEEKSISYFCASTKETKQCDKLSDDRKECFLENTQIGTHQEIKYQNKWKEIELSNQSLPIPKTTFFEKLLGHSIKRKKIPSGFSVKKSSKEKYLLKPQETIFFKMEIRFPFHSSGQFFIEAIGEKGAYGFLDPWWNSGFQYKKPITIDNTSNSTTLTDYQVLVKIDSTHTNFWNHVQSDGDDVRFVNSDETDELDFFNLYFNYADKEALYWVKVDSIPGSSTTTIYIYYGNGGASPASNVENTLSYSSQVDRFYAVSDVNGNNGASAITFFDNNNFEVGGSTDTDWDTGSAENPKSISSSHTGEGQNAQATKPFAIEASNVNSGEMWAPASWQSKIFVTTFPRTGTNFAFYNPSSSTASITVSKNGTVEENFNLSSGSYIEKTYTHTNNAHWKIESNQPILAFQWASSTYDQANIPPPAKVWHGIVRNTRVICSADNTSITIYFSDGTTESNADCDSTEVWSISKSGGNYGSGPSAKIVANKPVYAISYADGNGTELQAWYSDEDLDTEYLIPNNYDYLACSAPYDHTTITVYNLSGTQQTTSSDLGDNGANYPHHWKDSTGRSGGMRVVGDKPFYCYYEQAEQNDERNAANRVLNRKGTWPRPSVSSIGSEEHYSGPIFTQNYYRWYVNNNGLTPTDPWPAGTTDLDENTPIDSTNPVKNGDVLRLRISLQVSSANLAANAENFKIQYGEGSNCSTIIEWHDLGSSTSSDIWRGYNNSSPADGASLSSTLLSVSDIAESYEEENNSVNNPQGINIGQDGEWDWVIQNNGAPSNTEYCFRIVKADGTPLASYNNYPKLITNTPPNTPNLTQLFNFEKIADTTPTFKFNTSDASSDDIVYQIQWDTDYDFDSPTTKTSDTDSGFENFTNPSDTSPFNSGDTIKFTIQSGDALTNGNTYWWRVRAKDPNGSNQWSDWSEKRSFTIDTSVSASTWFQTTDEQFQQNTFNNIITGNDKVGTHTLIGEYGTTTLNDHNWTEINLGLYYNNLIVAASPRYAPTSDSQRAVRVRNKSSHSFQIKVDNYDNNFNGTTTVDWIAIDAGAWTIEDGSTGTKVIAGTKNVSKVYCRSYSNTPGELVYFNPPFNNNPAVIHTVSSENDSSWVISHIDSGSGDRTGEPTTSQMGLGLGRSFGTCTHNPENIDYIAFDTGHGNNNGVEFDATIGNDTVSCCSTSGYATNYTSTFISVPNVMVIGQMGEDGGDGGWAVTHTGTSPTTSTHYGSIDEDGPSADRSHTSESVGVIAFRSSSGQIIQYNANTGTLISAPIDFDDGNGTSWDALSWNDDETNGDIKYQIQYWDGDSWELIPDSDLSGNSTGFDDSPVDLSSLNTTTYNQIRIKANFTYSTGSPYLNDWTVTWNNGVLNVDIVDSSGDSVANPSLTMSALSFSFTHQTSTGTLGTSSEKIRITNTTINPQWTLTIAPTEGSTAFWDGSAADYDFNDPSPNASDGPDADSLGGQMTIDPSGATITPQPGCSTTGLSLGSSTAFNEGSVDSITLISAGSSAATNCYWDLTNVDVSQTIPPEQAVSSDYTLNMTLTITAS